MDHRFPLYFCVVQYVSQEGATSTTLRVAEFKPDVKHTFQFTSSSAIQEREAIKDLISRIIHDRLLRASAGGASSANGTPGPSGGSGASPGASSVMSDASAPGTPKAPLQARIGGPGPTGLRRGVNGAGSVDVEMQTRRALLAQNRELSLLHTELVVGKHISENEFWETRKSLLRNKAAIDQQQKGQSSAWLDLKPQTGESNDVKYVMTPQVIHSVCQQYPSSKSRMAPLLLLASQWMQECMFVTTDNDIFSGFYFSQESIRPVCARQVIRGRVLEAVFSIEILPQESFRTRRQRT